VAIREILYSNWLTYDKDYYLYHPFKAFDGIPETGWLEHSDGPGIGDYIGLSLTGKITIDRIAFMPGYFDPKWFKRNNRVKEMEIEVNGKKYKVKFTDAMKEQNYDFNDPISFDTIRFYIKDVYLSGTDNDTASRR
jgi:hypothetical protein